MKSRRLLALTIAALFSLPSESRAVTDTWDGGGADNNLATALNWLDNTAPASDLVNTDLIFGGVVRLTPNVSAAFSTNSITFNNTAGAFVVGGNPFNIGLGGIVNNDTQTMTLSNIINTNGVANSTINAASGGLTFTNAVNFGTGMLTVDGGSATSFANIGGTGTFIKQGAGTMTWNNSAATNAFDLVVADGVLNTAADGSTDVINASGSVAVNGSADLNLNESFTLDGAQLTRANGAGLTLAAGKTLTVTNGADATITGAFTNSTASTIAVSGTGSTLTTTSTLAFIGGSILNVSSGGNVSSGAGTVSIGTNANGTVTVNGSGSSLSSGTLSLGLSGATGLLTFSNGGTGAFAAMIVNSSGVAGTNGTLDILSGAAVSGTNLTIASSAAAVNSGTVTINGTNSAMTINTTGATSVGAASTNTGVLNVQNSGVFNSGTGLTTVNATGTVNITGGTFNQNGNMTLNGLLARDTTGVFTLAAGRTLTIQNGGDFTITGNYTHATASTVTVTGTGSSITAGVSNQLRFNGGSTLNVLAGGQVTAGGSVFLADTGNATALVDGAGSLLSSTSFGLSLSAFGNTSAAITFSNSAAGSFVTPMTLSTVNVAGTSSTVNILSGATVAAGGLTMANQSGPASATLAIDGAGSELTLTGSTASTIGALSASTALVTIDNGGALTTNTGAFTIQTTGTVNIPDGEFNANGNVNVFGQFSAGADADFDLAANRTLTVNFGGQANFTGDLILNNTAAKLTVNGNTSDLSASRIFATTSNTVTVSNGGDIFAIQVGLGSGVAMSASVTGLGSTLSAGSQMSIGNGTVTYSGGGSGAFGALELDADPMGLVAATGVLLIQAGSTVTAGTTEIASSGNPGAGNTSILTVNGEGSSYTQTGNTQLLVGSFPGGVGISTGTLNVVDGGLYSSGTGFIFLNTSGTINIDGGTLDLRGTLFLSGGDLNFNTGALKMIDNLTIGTGGLLGTSLTLDSTRQFTTTATTTIDAFRTLTLNGGTFSTGALVNNGTIAFNSGTLAVTGAGGLNIGAGPLGSSVSLGAGANLLVSQLTTVSATALLRIDGGSFTGQSVNNNGTIDHRDGILNIQATLNNLPGSRLFVGGLSFNDGGINNSGRITLQDGLGLIGGAGTILNTGIVTGDGTIAKALSNNAGGQLRAEAGKTLFFTGTVAANAGTYSLEGGTLEFSTAITNGATGVINGFGALRSALLTNNGNIGLSGDARFYGDVTNAAGAKIITSGGSTTTFYDDVIHNGTEIRTSAGGASVFFGAVSGAGPFTGTGTVYFEGDLKPGNSPASVSYEGDLVLGGSSSLTMELGGPTLGEQFDHLRVGGTLSLSGALDVELLYGFEPQLGQSFDLFDAGSVNGQFSTIDLPALAGGLAWDTGALYSAGTLGVTAIPEPGVWVMGSALAVGGMLLVRRRKS